MISEASEKPTVPAATWQPREMLVSSLDALGLRAPARSTRRFVDLAVTGARAHWSRYVSKSRRSPRVCQATGELPLPRSSECNLDELSSKNPMLNDLSARYRRHPDFARLASPYWQDMRTDDEIRNFRRHGSFLWTREAPYRYRVSARHVSTFDRFNLLRRFGEDSDFGCETLQTGGITLSRDKIDSALEIYFLLDSVGIGVFDSLQVLDIGAGYGRFAHRFTSLFPNAEVTCVDAIPMSTFLCDFYLKYRQVVRAEAVPFDELGRVRGRRFDFAVSIHSLPEQTSASIEYWLDLLESVDLRTLVVIDHDGRWLTMEQPDNRRGCYFPLLARRKWVLTATRPKYTRFIANLFGIYPEAVYAVFTRP